MMGQLSKTGLFPKRDIVPTQAVCPNCGLHMDADP